MSIIERRIIEVWKINHLFLRHVNSLESVE